MSYATSEGGRDRQSARAALFIDYDNIYHTLGEDLRGRGKREQLISEMLDALKQSLAEEQGTRTAVARAYADFTDLGGNGDAVQRNLYLQGVESCFVPGSLQSTTVEIQLCVDAMEVLHHRSDIDMFVLLTGRRTYLPLVQHFKRYAHRVLIAALGDPGSHDQLQQADDVWFFDARDLLSSTARLTLGRTRESGTGDSNGAVKPGSVTAHRRIDDPTLFEALEIIEEFFGHYDEVYLTPLLRKMSEILDERTYDPKALISSLEDHLAVRLEKRQGFPHDYTVLIVNRDHPDVARVQQSFADGDASYHGDFRSSEDGVRDSADGYSAGGERDIQDRVDIDRDGYAASDGRSGADFSDDFGGGVIDDFSDDFIDDSGDDFDEEYGVGLDAVREDDEFEGDDYDDPSREG